MKKISFFGASSDEVTGSCYLLTAGDGNEVLIDFGMFQGEDAVEKLNYKPLDFNPSALQGVFLTHAHLDHCGRLPLLIYGGFHKKIYMTEATKLLAEIILTDSAKIAEKDVLKDPLYTYDEVEKVLRMIEVVPYNTEITVGSFTAKFYDAGHILGSSSIALTDQSADVKKTIVFSGDLGNTPQSLVPPTEYITDAEYVIMESTYGDSAHPREDATKIIQEEMNAVEKNGGVLLIPAFSIERTQEILHIIHHLKNDRKVLPETPVFMDSPMAIDATSVYLQCKSFCSDEIKKHTDIPFNFEGLYITYDGRDSKDIVKAMSPKVIIAGSGMMNGGRMLNHAVNYLPLATTHVLFVGYQAEETLGRKVLEGARQILINNDRVRVNATIREIKILSSHADLPHLLTWAKHIKNLKKLFITHGEKEQRQHLKETIEKEIAVNTVVLPKLGDEIELD